MAICNMEITDDVLTLTYGDALNDQIVRATSISLEQIRKEGKLIGGQLLKINGSASMAASFVLAYRVQHYGAVAVFDAELEKYVIVISRSPFYPIGQLLD